VTPLGASRASARGTASLEKECLLFDEALGPSGRKLQQSWRKPFAPAGHTIQPQRSNPEFYTLQATRTAAAWCGAWGGAWRARWGCPSAAPLPPSPRCPPASLPRRACRPSPSSTAPCPTQVSGCKQSLSQQVSSGTLLGYWLRSDAAVSSTLCWLASADWTQQGRGSTDRLAELDSAC